MALSVGGGRGEFGRRYPHVKVVREVEFSMLANLEAACVDRTWQREKRGQRGVCRCRHFSPWAL